MPVVFRSSSTRVVSGVLRFDGGSLALVNGEAVYTPPGGGGSVPTSRLVSTTSPLQGGGDLSADRTLSILTASSTQAGALSASDWSTFNGKVGTTRSISTTAPLSGGGDLSADRTLSLSYSTGLTVSVGSLVVDTSTIATLSAVAAAYQPLDADLTALAGLGNGLPYRSGGTWSANALGDLAISGASMQVTQARGLRETSGPTTLAMGAVAAGELLIRSGTSLIGAAIGSVVQAYSAILQAIAGLGVTGLIARTGAGTAAARTLTSGSSQITITNGDGASGNPTISLSGSVAVAGVTALTLFCGMVGTAVTFDGTTAVSGFSGPSGRVYTASSAAFYDLAITVDTTGGDVTLSVKGNVFKCVSLAISGSGTCYIHFDGGSASGGTSGIGAAQVSGAALLGGTNGGAGRTTTGNGTNGGSYTNGIQLGGVGGSGGSSSGNPAGAGGALNRQWSAQSQYGDLTAIVRTLLANTWGTSSPTTYQLGGGSGGGSGALTMGGSSAISGAGGGGPGVVAFYCRSVDTGTGTLVLRAKGGNGGNATGGTGNNSAGGGGGGPGGAVLAVIGEITGSNAVQLDASGGNGGNGAVNGTGTNAAGGAGGPGGLAAILYGSAVTTPTANVAGGSGGTGAGGGAAGASGAAGTSYIKLAS